MRTANHAETWDNADRSPSRSVRTFRENKDLFITVIARETPLTTRARLNPYNIHSFNTISTYLTREQPKQPSYQN